MKSHYSMNCYKIGGYILSIRSISYLTLFLFAAILVLTGCFHEKTPIEKTYDVLEKVVIAEKGFVEQQDPLVSLEKNEKGIYDKIIGLGMKQYDQIVKLSNDALGMVKKRKEYMEKETASIRESKIEFKKVAVIKDKIEDPTIKKQANELYSIMMQRYKAHDTLYKEYVKGANGDEKLYQMFKDKNLSLEELEAQVNKLNDTYQKIYDANEDFNKLTRRYNDAKLKFYKNAGLNKN
jgi:hypothetical protein